MIAGFLFELLLRTDRQMKKKVGKILCSLQELDLGITLKGGQSFRWCTHGPGFRGVFHGCVWDIKQDEKYISYTVYGKLKDNENYDRILSQYFRLNISLKENYQKWTIADPYFKQYADNMSGVRILDQDVVENLFSFICSSNNNIIRISSMVEKLCCLFGKEIGKVDDHVYHDFPTIDSLTGNSTEHTLREEGFGYRAGYIAKAAKQLEELGGKEWLLSLHKNNDVPYFTAKEKLISLTGVGPKVADCICLMSLGHLEAIPVDTHIFQVAQAVYLPHLKKQKSVTPKVQEEIGVHLRKLWGPLAGWAQAVVFCVRINVADTTNAQKRKKEPNINSLELKIQKR